MQRAKDSFAEKANLVRKWCLISTTEAGSGHPTSCLSAADLATVLFDKFFTYDIKNSRNPNNDRFVLSKGHAAPLLYTLFAMSGMFPLKELMNLRKFTSDLEGHPTPRLSFVDAATGSLGQGLSVGCGLAYALRAEIRNSPRVYVLLGDGEMAEGSVWEAANFASYYSLNNLTAIVDVNRLGQSQETMFGHAINEYAKRFASFGWEVKTINGHNFDEIEDAFSQAQKSKKPFAIVAKTKKGKGISILEDKDGWHGKPLKKEELEKALEELGKVDDSLRFDLRIPNIIQNVVKNHKKILRFTQDDIVYRVGDQIATREVYGQVLAELGNDNHLIYALDGDTKNSTYSQEFKKAHPERFIECFIAEQNMVGVALGFSACGKIPFVSTFAAFLTRAFDQIRMSAVSGANIKFVGSHAGVSIGEDGPSQMGLEDIAMFGVLPDSIILHPSDAVSTARLLPLMISHKGLSYLRTLRSKTPVLYNDKEDFLIGGSKILRSAQNDILTVVAAGITVHEALIAHELLKKEGITIRVVDCYSIKPTDEKTLKKCVSETEKQIVISVEDHFDHGGLGDFALAALSGSKAHVLKLAVKKISHSGRPEELLDAAGISAKHIVAAVKGLV